MQDLRKQINDSNKNIYQLELFKTCLPFLIPFIILFIIFVMN